jgi:hypothetical protein
MEPRYGSPALTALEKRAPGQPAVEQELGSMITKRVQAEPRGHLPRAGGESQ